MKTTVLALLASLALAGCATAPLSEPAASPSNDEPPPIGSPFPDAASGSVSLDTPLILDREDLRLGTTVQYGRIPTPSELHDLTQLPSLTRVVITLEAWPRDYAKLEPLDQMPEGVELIVILPGWPYGRALVDPWNYLRVPLRIMVVVSGPPPSIDAVSALNQMRGLERVIAEMDDPSRRGFERLQRPLNFRKIIR